uniref:RRM domain-containing protein n=1 Tax=Ditylenchus dipsaci TaxID=166011 RepID=A0A915DME4_9BILA
MLFFVYSCRIPHKPCCLPNEVLQDIVLFFNQDACNKFIDLSRRWDRDLMFCNSNRHGLFIKLSGPQDARLVFERFHGRKFYGVIAVASYISENEYFASRRIF